MNDSCIRARFPRDPVGITRRHGVGWAAMGRESFHFISPRFWWKGETETVASPILVTRLCPAASAGATWRRKACSASSEAVWSLRKCHAGFHGCHGELDRALHRARVPGVAD